MTQTWDGRETPAHASVGRRALLRMAAAAGATALTVAGCTSAPRTGRPGASVSEPPGVDELARTATAADSTALLLLVQQARRTTPALVTVLDRLAAGHRAHLAALGAPDPTAATAAPSGSASDSGSPSGSPAAGTATAAAPTGDPKPVPPNAVVAAEWAAAARALAASAGTGGAMATLLARIAAGRAVHADLLGRAARLPALGVLKPATVTGTGSGSTPTTGAGPTGNATGGATGGATGDPSGSASGPASPGSTGPARSAGSRQALNDLLAGEHAAVFAYGLLAARATAAQRPLAQGLWDDHLSARDYLESRIVAVGDSPPVPAAAYDVGAVPSSAAQVSALAGRVEGTLASVAATAVAVADQDVRPVAASSLVTAARRAARWGTVLPLPGPPTEAGTVTASPTG